MARFSSKTEIDIDPTEDRATFSIWLNNESEAYTLRVLPLSPEEIEEWRVERDADRTHVLKDGSTEDVYFSTFQAAINEAWQCFQDTQSQNLEEAGY